MAKFKDQVGDVWDLDLSVGMVKRLRRDAGFDLDDLAADPGKVAGLFAERPERIAQVLWVMCAAQAQARGVDEEAFGFRLARGVIDAATEAFLEEFVLFYPRSSAGKAIAARLPEILRKADREIERRVNAELDAAYSPTATASPASPASTPTG